MDDKDMKYCSDLDVIQAEDLGRTADGTTPVSAVEEKTDETNRAINRDMREKTIENRTFHSGFVSACQLIWNPKNYKELSKNKASNPDNTTGGQSGNKV